MDRARFFMHLKTVLGLLAAVLLVLAAPLGVQAKITDADGLQQSLAAQGTARVLVQFNFPEYTERLAASRAFKAVAPDAPASTATVSAQAQADQALASAVASAAAALPAQVTTGSVQLVKVFQTIPFGVYSVDAAGLKALAALPGVLSIEEDLPVPLPLPVPGDSPAQLDAPQLTSSTTLIGADNLWNQGHTGSGIYVAVLDTGIRSSHEMFSGKTIVEACFSTRDSSANPTASLCPNGQDAMYGTGAARHYSSSYDGFDHGTHVAGIAAGNSSSVKGVAPGSGIIAVNVFSDGFGPSYCGSGNCVLSYNSDQLLGLEYVYSLRSTYSIASVNMSLGGGKYSAACDSSSLKSIIDNLRAAGIATVIAAGNSGYCDGIGSPACISSSFAIGSSTKSDVISSFSNFYDTLTPLFAPGSSIYSATGDSDTSYESWNGTSMAAPHVAGAFALLRSVSSSATVDTMGNALKNTGKAVSFNRCTLPSNPNRRIQVDAAAAQLGSSPATGQSDIWWNNIYSGANVMWFMSGVTRSGQSSLFSASPGLGPVCFGDFNGDGNTDAFFRNKSSGANYIVYMNKHNYSSHVSFNTIPAPWQVAGCGDFNSDGNVDVYWYNSSSGATGVTYLNGNGQWVGTAYGPSLPSGWALKAVADFNGDGKPDLLAHSSSSGQIVIGVMNGVSLQSTAYVATLNTVYDIKGAGKFTSASSNTDIIVRSVYYGTNAVLYMNGTAFSSSAFLDSVSSYEWDIAGAGVFH